MLSEWRKKVKYWAEENRHDVFIAALIFLVGMASFGLGRLSVLWPSKEPLTIIQPESASLKASAMVAGESVSEGSRQGNVVASKNGEFFHYSWCAGAKRIKEENKVWFATREEAIARGYKPASNCPGL